MSKPKANIQNQDFQVIDLAFLGSLVPGIIHNLATPMSGVLGATQLLENRTSTLTDAVASLEGLEQARRDELEVLFERNKASMDILSRNARHLAELLQVIVQRLNRGGSTTNEFFSFNDLLQNEIRFLDSNLTFKHKVRKQILLATDLPAAKYVYGNLASAIDEFVMDVLARHDLNKGVMEMDFATEADDIGPSIVITARYVPLDQSETTETSDAYLSRLRDNGWTITWNRGPGFCQIRMVCPKAKRSA